MPNLTFKRKLVWTAWAALIALAMTLSLGARTGVFAQTAHTKAPKEQKAPTADQQSAGDPKNVKVEQPTDGEDDALTEAMKKLFDRHTEGLKTTYFADGTVMVELTGDFMDASVIKINPDGSTSVECVTGMKAAEESIKAQGAGAKANSASGAHAAQGVQKAPIPTVKGETGKTPKKTGEDKSKWEVM